MEYFVNNFNIMECKVHASIYSESTKSNNLRFRASSGEYNDYKGLQVYFEVIKFYGRDDQICKLKVHVTQSTDFLSREYRNKLAEKLTLKLRKRGFQDKLNEAIREEKKRMKHAFESTMNQSEFNPEEMNAYFEKFGFMLNK